MIVFTSAKSTLTRPGTLMISAMPATALCRTSSARRNASSSVASSSITSNSFSLSTTISESTWVIRLSMPSSAMRVLRLPS